ncbi:MAG: hypothetical protein IJ896_06335 [Fibrobacter sp.]|nr:hypothetical protein [Fibrobacter sp.]
MIEHKHPVYLSLLFALFLATGAFAESAFSGGDGSSDNPYLIATTADMDQLAADVNAGGENLYYGKHFRLTSNLDYTNVTKDKAGNNYTPVGLFYSDGATNRSFRGFFDGKGHTIKGIRVSYRNDISGGTNGVGIFGFIEDGSVKDLTVDDCVFKGTTVGGVVGYNYKATIKNTHVKSSVIIGSDESSTANHGGIAGRNHLGTVEGNISEAQVICNEGQSCSIFGGIVGHALSSTTKNNLYLGTRVEGGSYVGWIVGKIEDTYPFDGNIYPSSLVGGGAGRENESTGLDIAGAAKPRSISLQENISLVPGEPEVSYSNGLKVYSWGLKYDGVTYYKPNGTISLAYDGDTFISGFQCSGSNGCEVSGSTLTIGFDIDKPITEVSTVASTGNANDPYLIMSASDWDHLVQMVDQGETFSGKFFKLTNNISVSTWVGSDSTTWFFAGTFDGAGNTITVSYGDSDLRIKQPFTAPFRFVNSGTIKNLHTAGSIYIGAQTNYKFAGGIAGRVVGNSLIDSCHSSVTIDTDAYGDRSHGGLVGIIKNGATTISNSYFNGKLLGQLVHGIGGLVGWVESRNDAGPATLTLTNCLFKPAQVNLATADWNDFATLARTGGSNLITTNCYYTQALGTVQSTKVSKSVSTNDLDTIVTAADGEVYYIPTNATISGISSTYNQGTSTADVVPVVTIGGQTLTNGVDYTFSITKDGNPVGETLSELGEHILTVQGEGTTYVGTISTTFQVIHVSQYGAITITANGTSTTAVIDGDFREKEEAIIDHDIQVNSVTFNRTFNVRSNDTPVYSTIMLPFSIKAGEVGGATFYQLSGFNKVDGKWKEAVVTPIGNNVDLAANTPYLLEASESTISFNNQSPLTLNTTTGTKSITFGNWAFRGTYSYIEYADSLQLIGRAYGFAGQNNDGIKIGEFVKVGSGAWTVPMRAYLVYNQNNSSPKSAAGAAFDLPETMEVVIVNSEGKSIGGGTLNTVTGEIRMDRWYDLQGRKLNGKPTTKGTYYHNGKRVIIK